MATIGINWAGVVVTLTHEEITKFHSDSKDDLVKDLADFAAAIAPGGSAIEAYLNVDIEIAYRVDRGNGIYLTVPWPAIWWGQWWLVIPTPRPTLTGAITVRRSNSKLFTANEDWTHEAYFGTRGTFFTDVTGDGRADAIVVNDDTVTVRRSSGNDFGPNEDWTHGPYFGTRGTFFADVDGDGKADAVVSNAQND